MKKFKLNTFLAMLLLCTTLTFAQATRTWVSGVGDDANPCSRTAPCKTWAGAMPKTIAGGEVDALDPGGFGAVTVTKAITLDGGGGQVASVLVAGTDGIVVNAGPNDVVIIRNLRLDGLLGGTDVPGLNGIRFVAGLDLTIENCKIFGFSLAGVAVELSQPGGSVRILNTSIENSGIDGVLVSNANASIRNSSIERSGQNGVAVSTGGDVAVSSSDISYALVGVLASGGATATISSSDLLYNTQCSLQNLRSTVTSYGNNRITGAPNCGPVTTASQQ